MKIWMVTIGEPVPLTIQSTARLHRSGQFAVWASSYADVTWWTSSFNHFEKRFVSETDSSIKISDALRIRLFKGCGYRRNISVKRILDQNILAGKILRGMKDSVDKPDVIVCSVPPVEIASSVLEYGAANNIPVILDMRDMWPDIFVDHAPVLLRPLARVLLSPFFIQAHKAFRKATAIIGITESFVDWGIKRASRPRNSLDRPFHFAYTSVPPSPECIVEANAFWAARGILKQDDIFTVCFFGSIGHQFEFDSVFRAFNDDAIKDKVRLVVCGTGDRLDYFKDVAKNMKNVHFAGWVDAPKIYSLMRLSHAGLDPLPDRYDFLATINNKAVEYLSAGLPIISCPCRGDLFQLLRKYGCGMSYPAGDARELASILASLAKDSQRISAMSFAAAKCFKERFDSAAIHDSMLGYLHRVVAQYKSV